MRLIVVVDDEFVSVDGEGYGKIDLDQLKQNNIHAIQWHETYGQIEYRDTSPNLNIDSIDEFSWVIDLWNQRKYEIENPPPPTPEELYDRVKYRAESELASSDWAVLSDVPLANKNEWVEYRSALRLIRSNITTDPVWPVQPPVIWITNE
jgi:hypothetical protein